MQIRVLAFLLLVPPFLACQKDQEKAESLAVANLDFSSLGVVKQTPQHNPSAAKGTVFQSADGGKTWQNANGKLPEDVEIWGLNAIGGDVFLCTATGLYRAKAGSETPQWQKEPFLNEAITDVFQGAAGLYAGNSDGAFFQEVLPGTGMWKAVYAPLKNKTVRTILETSSGCILAGCNDGIFRSADGGQTWNQVFGGRMVISLAASGGVLIGCGYQGVMRSTDDGEHWDVVLDKNILVKKAGVIGDRFFAILGTEDPSVVSPEGITSRLLTSSDGGLSWQRIDQEQAPLPLQGTYRMDERLSQVRDIYNVIQVGGFLFCSFDTGIYRSADQGKTWEPVSLSDNNGSFILATSGGIVYAVRGGGGC